MVTAMGHEEFSLPIAHNLEPILTTETNIVKQDSMSNKKVTSMRHRRMLAANSLPYGVNTVFI
jgi:hypothetical protein